MNTAPLCHEIRSPAFALPPPAGGNEITLQAGKLQTWDQNCPGLTLRALEGRVWITQPGEGADIILSAGQTFCARRSGKIVAESLARFARLAVSHRRTPAPF